MRQCCLLLLLWALSGSLIAAPPQPTAMQALAPLEITRDSPRINLTSHLLLLEDPAGNLTADRLLQGQQHLPWRQVHTRFVNEGKNHSVWWLQFALHNTGIVPVQGVLQVDYALLDQLHLYQQTPDGTLREQTGGDYQPFDERPVGVSKHWFALELTPGVHRFMLRVDSSSTVFIPLHYASWPASSAQLETSMLLHGLFYGVLLGLLAYNLFLLSSLREKTYFWYLLYLLNMVLFMAAFDGLAWKWINASVSVQTLTIYTLMFLHCAVSTQFSRYFLHTREQFPQLDLLLRSKILLVLLAMISLPLISVDLYNNMASLTVLISSIVLLFSGLYVWRRGFRYGSYYTLAWSLLLISLVLSTAGSLGYELPGIPYGSHWVKIGTCAEMILLSLGLADRINALKEARFHADESARQARLETRAQGRFLARMSHEIRTPMNGVLGMLQLLGDTRLDNRQRFYLDTISKSGQTLLTVINDILDFARLESGKVELEQLPFDPEELASDVTGLFTAQALEKRLALYCSVAPHLPRQLQGDPTRLKQILMNLLSNAFKFTEQGHVSLHLDGRPAGGERDLWLLECTIRDTGIGIAEQAQSQLFNSFTQADSSTTRRYGGTGLGLAISQELVRLMQGDITLQSTQDEGTSIRVQVPLRATELQAPRPDTPPVAALIARQSDAQLSYRLQLERVGYRVICQPDGTASDCELMMIDCQGIAVDQLQPLITDGQTPILLLRAADDHRPLLPGKGVLLEQTTPLLPAQLRELLRQLLAPQPASDEPPSSSGQPPVVRGHLLVAEDNPVNQLVVRSLLEKAGYSVEIAENGAEAVQRYRDAPASYSLILMDCEMPVLDGFEATRRIRAHEQREHLARIPVVALTAHVLDSHRLEGMTAGMDDYLAKPVENEQLFACLRRLIKPAAL